MGRKTVLSKAMRKVKKMSKNKLRRVKQDRAG